MTCESCQWRPATTVAHFEAVEGWAAATFVVCDLCRPVEVELTEAGLAVLR